MKFFNHHKTDQNTKARLGMIQTIHGEIQTPFFMPVGTNGTVKSLTFEDVDELGAQLVLANTYHLFLRPGMDIINKAGGLHQFIGWNKPMLTDSGGYQVFSLSKLRKISDDGVNFQSHHDGTPLYFTPEKVMEIQHILGSDMIMPLDECAPYPCERDEAESSVYRTTTWARRSKEYFTQNKMGEGGRQHLFGIVQGATFKDLREQSAKEILDIGFEGYAIGGVSVGEPVEKMFEALNWTIDFLPEGSPRYFMGIGMPDQIVKAVGEGIDMFDTVLPTRYGRHATAFTSKGKLILRNAQFADDFSPIDDACDCMVCQKYTKSYIRHLVNLNEITGLKLITYHNLYFYVNLMKDIRKAISEDRYEGFQKEFLQTYNSKLLNV